MNPLRALDDMRTIKRLLTDAEAISRELGDAEPGAEHLLLSALGLPDGTGARAMSAVGVDAAAIRTALVAEQAGGLVAAGVAPEAAQRLAEPEPLGDGGRPLVYGAGPSARDLFRAAGDRARRSRQRLGGAHVVAAAADLERGTLARVLDRLGVDRGRMREAAATELAGR